MADAEETLVGFVTAQYNKLKKELNPETDSNEDVKAVIVIINALFETFKNTDSKHDTVVAQLKAIQKKYDVNLNTDEYPHHKNALANLNAIMAALKEKEKEKEEE